MKQQNLLLSEIESLKSQLSRPPLWVDDSQRQQCVGCNQPFTWLNRRHHCRKCGDVFDQQCTKRRIELPKIGYMNAGLFFIYIKKIKINLVFFFSTRM